MFPRDVVMPRPSKIVIYGAIALLAVLFCSWLIKHGPPSFAKYRMKRLARRIEPWPSSTNYSVAGWTHLVKTAGLFQKADPKLAGEALAEYLRSYVGRPDELSSEQSKLFLLLRVVFELPESVPGGQRLSFCDWTRQNSGLNADGTANLAWPLSWNEGRPRLVAARPGTAAGDYAVRDEYVYLRYHFRYRNLSSFKLQGSGTADGNPKE